jgi:hypothetical protein
MQVHCTYSEMVDINQLVGHPRNPNEHPGGQIERLAKILSAHGWRHPVTVSKRSGYVVAGHGRIEAAKYNGWTEVPVDRQDFESEAAEYQHMIADNSIAEMAELDLSMINEDILALGPFDIDLLGISDFTVEPLDKMPELPKEKKEKICPHCGEVV